MHIMLAPERTSYRLSEFLDGTGEPITIIVPKAGTFQVIDDTSSGDETIHIEVNSDAHFSLAANIVQRQNQSAPVKRTYTIECVGSGAQADLYLTGYSRGKGHITFVTKQVHKSPHTKSNVTIRSVSSEKSKVSSQCNIFVDKGANVVNADQVHQSLLLDDGVRMYAEPQLEVIADDVSCSHGAVVTTINDEQMFYLMSRGVNKDNAKKLLVESFLTHTGFDRVDN